MNRVATTPQRDRSSDRNLLHLVTGNAVSSFGNSIYLVAIVLYLKETTQSPLTIGSFQFLALIPGFLLIPVSGALIDRWNRRTILIVADAVRGILMIGVGLLLFGPWRGSVEAIFVLAVAAGVGHAFFVPAAQTIIPEIVPPDALNRANALRTGSSQVTNMAGNAVGGLLFATIGAPAVLVVNGVTFIASAFQERTIRVDMPVDRTGGNPRLSVAGLGLGAVESMRYLRTHGEIRRAIFSQGGMFLLSPAFLLAVPFILIDRIGADATILGIVFAISLAGGIVAFAALSRISPRILVSPVFPSVAYTIFGTAFLALAFVPTIWIIGVGAFLAGSAAASVYLSATVSIQHTAPQRLHGRLFAMMEGVSAGIAPVAYLATGWGLERLGPANYEPLFIGVAFLAVGWSLRLFFARVVVQG